MELINQGAEAKLYKSELFGRPIVVKQRFKKLYRHSTLDEKLTRKRTVQEARTMLKCRKAGIKTPLPYFLNMNTNEIYMEYIEDSLTLREKVDTLLKETSEQSIKELSQIGCDVGILVSKLHSVDIIHGDLTTSNILVQPNINVFTLIDFGLSSISTFNEDMGVDLYVLERAFLSTHPNTEWLFDIILESYFKHFSNKTKAKEVREKLEEIRLRGRKRVMIG